MLLITMYDSVDVSQIPANPQAVAGYVGGYWPNYSLLVKKFPHALHKSIAINASENADILDVEIGDAVPADAPGWVKAQLRLHPTVRPGVYANASTMPSVVQELSAAGLNSSHYTLWVAHYTGVQPSYPFEQGADAVQFTDHALGRNLDESICDSRFFGWTPPHVNPPNYALFDVGPFRSRWGKLNERKVVEQYDGARKNPLLAIYVRAVLRPKLQFLADRVEQVAFAQPLASGMPSWNLYHRRYRYLQLLARAHGQRFV